MIVSIGEVVEQTGVQPHLEKESGNVPATPGTEADDILWKARQIVQGDWSLEYGFFADSFLAVAQVWTAILKRQVTPGEVGLCMLATKLVREAYVHKEDNLVDIAAYALCVSMLRDP